MYAWWTVKKDRSLSAPWWKLAIIPLGLSISTPLFFAAWAVARSSHGRSPDGAKLKFILCGAGLFVEAVAHIRMSRLGWLEHEEHPVSRKTQLTVSDTGMNMRERLEAITTIILGEVSDYVEALV